MSWAAVWTMFYDGEIAGKLDTDRYLFEFRALKLVTGATAVTWSNGFTIGTTYAVRSVNHYYAEHELTSKEGVV